MIHGKKRGDERNVGGKRMGGGGMFGKSGMVMEGICVTRLTEETMRWWQWCP